MIPANPIIQKLESTPDQPSDRIVETSPIEPKIREEFHGFVEKIEGDSAYIRLDTPNGQRLRGPYPATELTALGIGERNHFILRTIDLGRDVRIELIPIPTLELTAERERDIEDETERLFDGFDPSDDY